MKRDRTRLPTLRTARQPGRAWMGRQAARCPACGMDRRCRGDCALASAEQAPGLWSQVAAAHAAGRRLE
jgi:hypothetical protein